MSICHDCQHHHTISIPTSYGLQDQCLAWKQLQDQGINHTGKSKKIGLVYWPTMYNAALIKECPGHVVKV